MLRRLLLTLTLALLFGLGQQGAAVHAISHLAESQQKQPQDKSSHAPLCDKCVVYAELASAVAGSIFALLPATQAYTASIGQSLRAESAPHFPYAARAPPVLA